MTNRMRIRATLATMAALALLSTPAIAARGFFEAPHVMKAHYVVTQGAAVRQAWQIDNEDCLPAGCAELGLIASDFGLYAIPGSAKVADALAAARTALGDAMDCKVIVHQAFVTNQGSYAIVDKVYKCGLPGTIQ